MAALASELLLLSDSSRFRADNLLSSEDWGEWKKEGQYWAEGGGMAYRPGYARVSRLGLQRGPLMHIRTLLKTLWLLTGDIRPVCNWVYQLSVKKLHLLHFCLSGSELESDRQNDNGLGR